MVGRGLGIARFPQVERLAEAGWVRVGRQGGDTVVAWRTSTGRIPLALSNSWGQLRAVLMCWAMLSSVFVLEYYLDTLWKGTLLFIVCLVLVFSGVLQTVQKQETWCFSLYGMAIGLWLMVSSIPRRRLVLNHTRGMYHFSISGRTVCQGPMHLVYVRLALSSDVYGRCFFQLVLCGHKLEPLVLVQLSERYEQMEFLGRHIARKLNINYFDYLASSYRHVVRHWPLGATFSPGIVQRKTQIYTKSSVTDLDV